MSWGGTMTCNVINNTGGTITGFSIFHQWNDSVDEPLLTGQPVPDRETIPFTIHVGEGGSDDWTLKFIDAAGNCWYRDAKQCDVEQEDLESGQPVQVILNAGSSGFSILTPVSQPCPNNYYDSCS